MSKDRITINYSAITADGKEKKWTGWGDGIELGGKAAANYHLSEFKADSIMIDGEEITKYLENCEKVKSDFVDVHTWLVGFVSKVSQGEYVPPSNNDVLERLRVAVTDAICKADQEGYERAVKDQQEAIENHKEYVLPSARFAAGGYVRRGRIDNGEIAGVLGNAYIVPSALYSGKSDAEIRDEILKAQSEVAAESRLEIIDDSPFEPEERARYIAKQMINAALDEHMAKLEGGK